MDIDLSDSHILRFFSWSPDRSIESNRVNFEGIADIPCMGATVRHKKADGSDCMGAVHFDLPEVRALEERCKVLAEKAGHSYRPYPMWKVESWEPLTLSPSLLCSCGDHGFVRNGKWVRA